MAWRALMIGTAIEAAVCARQQDVEDVLNVVVLRLNQRTAQQGVHGTRRQHAWHLWHGLVFLECIVWNALCGCPQKRPCHVME
jgi:hypothetical protein